LFFESPFPLRFLHHTSLSQSHQFHQNYLRDIEKLIGNRIQITTVEGFEPDPNYVPAEKTQRSRIKHKSRNPNKGFPRRGSRR